MRFAIVFLLSSLLVLALASEPSRYGNLARYKAHKGPDGDRIGVVLDSKPDEGGHHYLAPLGPSVPYRQKFTTLPAQKDHVVQAHAADISHTKYTRPFLADTVRSHHLQNTPSVSRADGAAEGSRTHDAAHTLANFHKSGRWWGSRRRR